MSSTDTQTHSSSLAQEFARTGYKGTSITNAVIELIQSCMGFRNPGENITNALQKANVGVANVVPKPAPEVGPIGSIKEAAANDSHIHEKRTSTNG